MSNAEKKYSSWLMKAKATEIPLDQCNEIVHESNISSRLTESQICPTNTARDGKNINSCLNEYNFK